MTKLTLTQAQYDALTVKSSTTLYMATDTLNMYKGSTAISGDWSPWTPSVISIAVTTPPTKVAYKAGETLNLSGMVVTATYDNGTTLEITGYTTSPVEGAALTTEDTLITVTYNGLTCTQAISVIAMVSIAVTTAPTKTSYKVGDTLDLTGIVVTGTYTDGTTIDITSQCTFNPADGSTLSTGGTVTITATYSGLTATTTVSVIYLQSISISWTPYKMYYFSGETSTIEGIRVQGTYSDGTTAYVEDQCTCSPTTVTTSDTSLTVSCQNVTTTQAIKVVDSSSVIGIPLGDEVTSDTITKKARIFYINPNDNGAVYKFFDKDGNELTTQTVEGLATASYYRIISGTPTFDKFYVARNDTSWFYSYLGRGWATSRALSSEIGYGKSNSPYSVNESLFPDARDLISELDTSTYLDWYVTSCNELVAMYNSGIFNDSYFTEEMKASKRYYCSSNVLAPGTTGCLLDAYILEDGTIEWIRHEDNYYIYQRGIIPIHSF